MSSQRGVALITAMLLMVIGVILAAQIAWDNQLHVRRATLAADMEQARLFAQGAEAIAIVALRADYEDYPDATTLPTHADPEVSGQLFDAVEIPVGIDDQNLGVMYGKLEDLQGRFNLNNLLYLDASGSGEAVPDPDALGILSRLLIQLNLDEGIADAIVDWMDPDSTPASRGAEDGVYTGLNPPYRPANRGFTHVSELRAVAGIDEQAYQLLKNYVTALPYRGCTLGATGGATPININFADVELIGALTETMSTSVAEGLVSTAEIAGIQSEADLGAFASDPDYGALKARGSYIGWVTHCFGLTVYVTIGNSVLSMYSVLERTGTGKDVYVRQRIFGIEDAG